MEGLKFEVSESLENENIVELIHNSFFKDGNKEGKVLSDRFNLYGIVDLKRTTNKNDYISAYDYLYIIPYLIFNEKLSIKLEKIIELTHNNFIPELKFNIKRMGDKTKKIIKSLDKNTALIRLRFQFSKYNDTMFAKYLEYHIINSGDGYNKYFNEIKNEVKERMEKTTDERIKTIYEHINNKIENNEISYNMDTMEDLLITEKLDDKTFETINNLKESK